MAVLVMASVALAATRNYSGKLENGGKVNLNFEFKRGDPIKTLPGSLFRRIPMRCDGGRKYIKDVNGLPELTVNAKGKFRYSNSVNGFSYKVVGRFVSNKKVKGRLRYKGPTFFDLDTVPPKTYTDCNTGGLRWTAKR